MLITSITEYHGQLCQKLFQVQKNAYIQFALINISVPSFRDIEHRSYRAV